MVIFEGKIFLGREPYKIEFKVMALHAVGFNVMIRQIILLLNMVRYPVVLVSFTCVPYW